MPPTLRHVQRAAQAERRFEYVRSGEHRLRVAVEGEGPLVLLVHGWPESWYSWRKQLGPIAAAGFTAAAIDVRGYGGSDCPHAIEAYDMQSIVGDIQAAADQLGGGKAILIGHDWGAPIVWNSALIDAKRFTAVAGLSIPYLGQGSRPLIDIVGEHFAETGKFFYQLYMQREGVAEREMEADIRSALRKIYFATSADAPPNAWPTDKIYGDTLLHRLIEPMTLPAWLTESDIDYLAGEFERTGFRGSVNRYRNSRRDFYWLGQYAEQRIRQPAMFIAGQQDFAYQIFAHEAEARMRDLAPRLRGFHLLPNCGHWTQQEKPDEVNALLLDWLKDVAN